MDKVKKLLHYMKGNRTLYVLAIVSIAAETALWLAQPLVIRYTVDSVIGGRPMEGPAVLVRLVEMAGGTTVITRNLWICGIALIMLTMVRGVFLYFKGTLSAKASESTAKRIRDSLYGHLHLLTYDYHVKAETGDLIQRCTSDVETVRRFLSSQFVEMGRAVFLVLLTGVIMFRINTRMAMLSMIVIPGIFAFAYLFFKKVQTAFQKSDEAEGRLSNVLQESLTGIRVVRAFARQHFEIEKFEEKNAQYSDLTMKVIKLLAWYWAVSDFFSLLQIAAVLVFGAFFAVRGVITMGTFLMFFNYVGRLLWPVRQMGRILTEMGKTSVSLGRIQNIFDQDPEPMMDTGEEPEIRGAVKFENVGFEYEPGKPIIKGISFEVNAGETIAILGPTGSGKSTLMHLIPRLYECTTGKVTIDGRDVRDINKRWLRRNVGIVLQEPFLYSKTIRDNIGITLQEMDPEQVEAVSKVASLHDTVLEFDKEYETLVGEQGVTLSGGQRQRVAIARTLIKDAPVLILDDSLSAVDTETDSAIRKSLAKKGRRVTTFIIAHRLTTLAEADRILVLDDGRLVQQGTHEELLSRDGLYKRIWDIQNDLEAELAGEMALDGRYA